MKNPREHSKFIAMRKDTGAPTAWDGQERRALMLRRNGGVR